MEHVDQMRSDYGGTELLDPLRDILTSHNADDSQERMKEVFLLIDGGVGNTEQVINFVQEYGYNFVFKLMKESLSKLQAEALTQFSFDAYCETSIFVS